ncbi:transporter substrate-binding domain-containing protein [Vibrio sp. JC009]|uniref:substrate-binding periplasmic protein n=1 Tax=Vibrio sp. JC009 TaxID=2912314 RepID=UPI0023AFB2CC|nr:transporter substrate-binding domain-containing protein [Vibrio sp. JC009]WED20538.1 transporter substrate-binding domain-containing protein [Vibrio sp. JC009]
MKKWLILPLSVLAIASSCLVHAETIRVKKVEGAKEELTFEILQLALSKSAPGTQYQQSSEKLNDARLINEVEANRIDVMWAGAAPEREQRMLTVRVPILKGLLGHRIFIIRSEDQAKFARIKTLSDLKKYNAGQGTFWGDTKVLKNAAIPTVTTIKYGNLFPMLEGGRFDYFPRAVHEPWTEVKSRPELNLVVDKNVMLVYPFAMYFFVNKENRELHDKIYQGFETAISDGSFDKLFFNHPMIKDVLNKANLKQRTVFRIDNQNMHPDTPYDRAEFWLDVNKL